MLMQVISIVGAVLVLGAYAAHQLERLPRETYTYQLMNLFGGASLFAAATLTGQFGLMIVEGAWAVISLGGLVQLMRRR